MMASIRHADLRFKFPGGHPSAIAGAECIADPLADTDLACLVNGGL
jgi:hypothetical protein